MEESLQISLRLLVIGMTTVCSILLLVVLSSKALISIMNKFFVDVPKHLDAANINPKVLAAINAAVAVVTNNQGEVESIQKK